MLRGSNILLLANEYAGIYYGGGDAQTRVRDLWHHTERVHAQSAPAEKGEYRRTKQVRLNPL